MAEETILYLFQVPSEIIAFYEYNKLTVYGRGVGAVFIFNFVKEITSIIFMIIFESPQRLAYIFDRLVLS